MSIDSYQFSSVLKHTSGFRDLQYKCTESLLTGASFVLLSTSQIATLVTTNNDLKLIYQIGVATSHTTCFSSAPRQKYDQSSALP